MAQEKTKFLDQLGENDSKKTGIISLSNYHKKQKDKTDREKAVDPLNKYVKHFSNIADMVEEAEKKGIETENVLGFAQGIRLKVMENKVKLDYKSAIMGTMLNARKSRLVNEAPASPELLL